MKARFPSSPFWDFSLRLYAKRGIADACLRLQARHGIDVNLLFCCLWRGAEGHRLSRREIAALIVRAKTIHEQVVKPLRASRTALKTMLEGDATLAAAMETLRAAIKKSELDAEHVEQLMLAGMFDSQPRIAGRRDDEAAALANAESYCAALGLRLSAADRADLAMVVDALETGKAEPSHTVELTIQKAEDHGRRPPLARDRGGA
jgi:uncharacterized protein (TIGR02444 family)